MNYLSVEELSIHYGDKLLFDKISFGIQHEQKIALVAKNGTGKTTLLKTIAGLEDADSGKVTFRKGIRYSFLEQEDRFEDHETANDLIYKTDQEEILAIKEYEASLNFPDDAERMSNAFEKMNTLNAWDFEVTINQILTELKIIPFLHDEVKKLSGGQRKRIALAKVLIDKPDFMILDEPTNHLDLDMIEWLEDYLSREKCTIFMVTHDRYFLEVICDEIYELHEGDLHKYKGSYSYYLEKKAEREDVLSTTIGKAKSLMTKELEWIRRQPKARGTKQKARTDAFYETKKVASQRIQKDNLVLEIKGQRLGSKIIEFHKASKAYGDLKILEQFEYTFKKGEKIGIVGKNGVGKSTFLNLILGNEEVDSGKIVIGETVVFGYYNQKGMKFKDDQKVIDVIKDIAEFIPLEKGKTLSAAQMLERFLFPTKMHYNYVYKLSGGEKRRLYLLTVLMTNPNFLILDEPTNDLDIYTLSVLEDYLQQFGGCVIVVSHDRYFMDKIVDHMFVFEGEGQIKDILGNYNGYRVLQKKQIANQKKLDNEAKKNKEAKQEKVKQNTKKLSYKEQREFDQLEKDIQKLETEKENLTVKLNSGSVNNTEIITLGDELGKLVDDLDEKSMRWLELAELKG